MSGPVISYEPFEMLILSLRADGLVKEADRLHFLMQQGNKLSSATRDEIEQCFEMVTRVWPNFPR